MSNKKKLQIRCLNCKKWFDSPIFFADLGSFDTATLEGNKVQCQNCGKMTGCNKENMKLSSDDGGFLGKET